MDLKKTSSSFIGNAMHQHQFLTDEQGHKKAVVLRLEEYKKLLSLVEDALDIKMVAHRKNDKRIAHEDFCKLLKEDGLL